MSKKYDPDTIKEIAEYNAHQLAHRADSWAQNEQAEGFFYSIRNVVLERVEDITDPDDWEQQMVEDYSGQAHEIADGAPDVYTWTRWQEFVGTQAWQEDITDFGEITDLEQAAGTALYIIAQRLVYALAQEINDSIVDDDDEEDEEL